MGKNNSEVLTKDQIWIKYRWHDFLCTPLGEGLKNAAERRKAERRREKIEHIRERLEGKRV